MKVWLIESGEPLPTDPTPGRLWRIGLLAEILWRRGHDVTWWAGTFDHAHKKQRAGETSLIALKSRYAIWLLLGSPYRANVSIARLRNHRQVANEFAKVAKISARPDLILCCVPTLELAGAAASYAKRNDVPLVLDYRDLWPEIFVEPFPRSIRPFVRLLIHPWFVLAKKAFASATAVTGITDEFVSKALEFAGRALRPGFDRSFNLAYSAEPVEGERLGQALAFWRRFGIVPGGNQFVICYFGQLSKRVELETAISAAILMEEAGERVRLVLCGKGEMERECRQWCRMSSAVILPGFVDLPEIQALMKLSDVGILPYPSTPDFAASIPNKVIEYFSGGLPVVSSVRGIVSELLAKESAGLTYSNGNRESLAGALSRYLHDPDLRRSHAANARRLFGTRFTAEKVYGEMADHLERVALGMPASPLDVAGIDR